MPRLAGARTDASPTDPNNRTKLLVIILAAVVVIAAIFLFVVKPALSSSSKTASPSTTTTTPSTRPSTTPTPAASPTPAPESLSGSTRDPFALLPAEKVAATTTAATAAPAVVAAAIPAPVTTTAAAATTHKITLVSVFPGTAVKAGTALLTVDSGPVNKTVKVGDTVSPGVVCIKITGDSVFVTYLSQAYAIAPKQTITF